MRNPFKELKWIRNSEKRKSINANKSNRLTNYEMINNLNLISQADTH